MKQQPIYCNHSVCHLCSRRENTKMKIRTMSPSSRILMLTMTSLYLVQVVSAETLCGGELVDALQFVCGTRGFYFSRPNSRSTSRRTQKGIVEECCFRSCDLYLLEQYCAKPTKSERAVSDASVLVIPVLLPANKKPPTSMYSKYEIWERKAAQRLRRGIPAILRAKKFRKQAVEAQARDQEVFHRTLIPLRSKLPPGPSRTEQHAIHK